MKNLDELSGVVWHYLKTSPVGPSTIEKSCIFQAQEDFKLLNTFQMLIKKPILLCEKNKYYLVMLMRAKILI